MSVTVSTCNEICNSPCNTSPAKMLYTFPKGQRFPKRKIIMCDKFYDTKQNSPARTTTLGFGNKYDFTKDVPKSPSPNHYNLRSEFQCETSKDRSKRKGFGFGCGREEMEITGPFVNTLKNKNPAPSLYTLKSTLEACTSFSMRGKNYHDDHQKAKIPGPGTYPVCFAISQNGTYYLSKYKNSCVRNFKTTAARGKAAQSRVPGPGAYDLATTDLSPQGKYCLSKMMSAQSRRFGTSQRSNNVSKLNTPGPGNYKLPSQFGYYQAKNVAKKPTTQQNTRKVRNLQQIPKKQSQQANKQNKENKENIQHSN